MRIAVIDFETFWSDLVTLKKLEVGAYLAHPEFECISVSVALFENRQKIGNTAVAFGEAGIRSLLARADINSCMVVSHNAAFDMLILAWKLGFHPKMMGCTLSMARAVYGHETGLSLSALVKHVGVGVKNDAILHSTKGKHLADMSRDELLLMAKYNRDDTDQCADLFFHLLPYFNMRELMNVDMALRARVYPVFTLNRPLLQEALVIERQNKGAELRALAELLGITDANPEEAVRKRLSSTPKFAALLTDLGVEVPIKPSPKGNGKMIPALAKTDEEFLELCEDDDPVVAAAAAARLSVKSTLVETRIGKMLAAQDTTPGKLLVCPYKYYGAKVTGRLSGEFYNMQNLPRIIKDKPKNSDALRRAVVAPEGYLIGVADQSSIELRINHFLWQVPRSMALYRQKATADLYRDYASAKYGILPSEVSDTQRQGGKVAHLGLGFGSGPATLRRIARTQFGIPMSIEDATTDTYAWRDTYREIPAGWRTCQQAIEWMASGIEAPIDPAGLCNTIKNGLVLPSGRILRYPHLRRAVIEDAATGSEKVEWVYGVGRFTRRIYGPKLDENIVQAIARDTVFENGIQFFKDTGLRWGLSTHDELGYLFPEGQAAELLAHLQELMRTPPKWWPWIVLWSEGGVARSYADTK